MVFKVISDGGIRNKIVLTMHKHLKHPECCICIEFIKTSSPSLKHCSRSPAKSKNNTFFFQLIILPSFIEII